MENILELYAVRNKKGKWFHAKGYSGYGDTWVDDINKAKIYTKIGQARGRVSFFANNYPKYGTPDLIILKCTQMEVVDETERVLTQKKKKEIAKKKAEIRNKKYWSERYIQNIVETQKKLEELNYH